MTPEQHALVIRHTAAMLEILFQALLFSIGDGSDTARTKAAEVRYAIAADNAMTLTGQNSPTVEA